MQAAIPNFYLYGEPRRLVDERFVHVESLDDRTRPSEWTIRPHVHAELNHVFHVVEGGGHMQADSLVLEFTAPCLLLVPSGTVHGFHWNHESSGSVLTLASSYLADLVSRDPALDPIFRQAAAVPCCAITLDIAEMLKRLSVELGWAAPGYHSAAERDLLGLLVAILRQIGPGDSSPAPGPEAAIVARMRQRISDRFRKREAVESYATALGVSQRRLRQACAEIAHQSPSEMLDHRTMLEAKRSLLYGNLSVAEIGYGLGFLDPAYFSRFFTRHEGVSPVTFRREGKSGGRREMHQPVESVAVPVGA